jgi:hypothetical protein
MPYITEKTLANAIKMVELYDDIKTQCCGNNDIITRMEANEEIQRFYNIVAKHSKASKRHTFNAVMCRRCDCLVVKMDEHLKTYKCMKAFETKEFAVYDEKPVNNEMVRSVNGVNRCMGAIKNKNRNAYIKNIAKLTPERKAKINARTQKVMKKKMSGIELEKRTPNEIAIEYKTAREMNKEAREISRWAKECPDSEPESETEEEIAEWVKKTTYESEAEEEMLPKCEVVVVKKRNKLRIVN